MNRDFLDPNISDAEFARRIASLTDELMATVSTDDLQVNPEQLKKFNDLVDFFRRSAKDLGGRIESVNITPAIGVGDLTANFVVFDIAGDDIQKYCDVIRNCSAISMDVTTDQQICISCTVPNIFTLK